MTAKTAPKLTETATKADEIAFIESVAQNVPAGTYLHDLFTESFLAWVRAQIRGDVCPDIMNLVAESRESERAAQATIREQQAAIREQMQTIASVRLDLENVRKTTAAQLEAAETAHRRIIAEYTDAAVSRIADLEAQLAAAQAQAAAAHQQVATLKIAIFDLQNPGLA